jgi:hypothetical protein
MSEKKMNSYNQVVADEMMLPLDFDLNEYVHYVENNINRYNFMRYLTQNTNFY